MGCKTNEQEVFYLSIAASVVMLPSIMGRCRCSSLADFTLQCTTDGVDSLIATLVSILRLSFWFQRITDRKVSLC